MNRNIRRNIAFLALPLALALSACDDDDDPMALDEGTIVQTAQEAGSFSTLLTALDVAGLTSALEGTGPFTVFAPTDAAFAEIDPEVLNDILADTDLLTRVLTYHVVQGEFTSTDVAGLDSAPTLNGKDVGLSFDGTTVMVDGATVISPDIGASNGIIHVIDKVLLPEPVADILQTAEGAGVFNTLLAAVEAAGLTSTLQGDGPFTVFAPTDDAFAEIDPAALERSSGGSACSRRDPDLSRGSRSFRGRRCAGLGLPYHGKRRGRCHLPGQDGNALIDDAIIIDTDIGARNGIIHVIDKVIFPN